MFVCSFFSGGGGSRALFPIRGVQDQRINCFPDVLLMTTARQQLVAMSSLVFSLQQIICPGYTYIQPTSNTHVGCSCVPRFWAWYKYTITSFFSWHTNNAVALLNLGRQAPTFNRTCATRLREISPMIQVRKPLTLTITPSLRTPRANSACFVPGATKFLRPAHLGARACMATNQPYIYFADMA